MKALNQEHKPGDLGAGLSVSHFQLSAYSVKPIVCRAELLKSWQSLISLPQESYLTLLECGVATDVVDCSPLGLTVPESEHMTTYLGLSTCFCIHLDDIQCKVCPWGNGPIRFIPFQMREEANRPADSYTSALLSLHNQVAALSSRS
eukprot:772797-Pelagomonas_calceolata.AAC.2